MDQKDEMPEGGVLSFPEETPKPGTPEMGMLLSSVIDQLLSRLPMQFYNCDVMAATASILITTGLRAVSDGGVTKEEVERDIIKVVKAGIANFQPGEPSVVVIDARGSFH